MTCGVPITQLSFGRSTISVFFPLSNSIRCPLSLRDVAFYVTANLVTLERAAQTLKWCGKVTHQNSCMSSSRLPGRPTLELKDRLPVYLTIHNQAVNFVRDGTTGWPVKLAGTISRDSARLRDLLSWSRPSFERLLSRDSFCRVPLLSFIVTISRSMYALAQVEALVDYCLVCSMQWVRCQSSFNVNCPSNSVPVSTPKFAPPVLC